MEDVVLLGTCFFTKWRFCFQGRVAHKPFGSHPKLLWPLVIVPSVVPDMESEMCILRFQSTALEGQQKDGRVWFLDTCFAGGDHFVDELSKT
jgi:hypothetical protein